MEKPFEPSPTNVVPGKKCVDCCQNNARFIQLQTLDTMNELLGVYIGNEQGQKEDLALVGFYQGKVPPTKMVDFEQFRINRVKTGISPGTRVNTAKGVGIVSVIALAYELIPKGQRAEDAVALLIQVQNMLELVFNNNIESRSQVFSCKECCRKGLLSQSNPRAFTTEEVRKRV